MVFQDWISEPQKLHLLKIKERRKDSVIYHVLGVNERAGPSLFVLTQGFHVHFLLLKWNAVSISCSLVSNKQTLWLRHFSAISQYPPRIKSMCQMAHCQCNKASVKSNSEWFTKYSNVLMPSYEDVSSTTGTLSPRVDIYFRLFNFFTLVPDTNF